MPSELLMYRITSHAMHKNWSLVTGRMYEFLGFFKHLANRKPGNISALNQFMDNAWCHWKSDSYYLDDINLYFVHSKPWAHVWFHILLNNPHLMLLISSQHRGLLYRWLAESHNPLDFLKLMVRCPFRLPTQRAWSFMTSELNKSWKDAGWTTT